MKKYLIIFLIAIVSYSLSPTVKATDEQNLIESQADSLGISTFLSDSEKCH